MSKYIDKQKILTANMYGNTEPLEYRCYAKELINSMPTEDVAPDWINVRDRVPSDENEVLVCTISKKGIRGIDKGYYFGDRFIHRGSSTVTHWMPLPPFPEV